MSKINDAQNDEVGKSRQIPADLGRFRTWADKECINWPAWLQIDAYNVCMGKHSIEQFKNDWSSWSRG